jgi:hypothetical protein
MRTADPEIFPAAALIVAVPAAVAVVRPVVSMAATAEAEDVQVTDAVKSCELLSENTPVAVNCCVVPVATVGVAGVTAMEISVLPLPPLPPPQPHIKRKTRRRRGSLPDLMYAHSGRD